MAAFRNHPVAQSITIEEGVFVAPEATIACPCVIRSGAQICGRSVIGAGCIIENGAQIFDSDVGENCHIHRGASMILVGMGRNCHMGAGASIYHNSTLGDNVEVGAGVDIGERVYIGDGCRIRAGVAVLSNSSIPAGTDVTEDYNPGQIERARVVQEDDDLPLVPVAVIVADPVAAIPQDRRASFDDAARRELMELHERVMLGRQELAAYRRERLVPLIPVNAQRHHQNLHDDSIVESMSLMRLLVIIFVLMVIMISSTDMHAVLMNFLHTANGICSSINFFSLNLGKSAFEFFLSSCGPTPLVL